MVCVGSAHPDAFVSTVCQNLFLIHSCSSECLDILCFSSQIGLKHVSAKIQRAVYAHPVFDCYLVEV